MIKLKIVQDPTSDKPEVTEVYNNNKLVGFVEKLRDTISEDHPFNAYVPRHDGMLFVGMFYLDSKHRKHAMDEAVDRILSYSA